MNEKQATELIKQVLPKERVDHSLRVAQVAKMLAKHNNINEEQIQLAAILHDYAKNHSTEELRRWILSSRLPKDLLFYHPAIWHGPVGALMLKQKHGINHPNILNAIQYHTTGRPHMTDFEKIIFIADYIEPKRNFPGLEKIREKSFNDLTKTTYLILENTIQYLISKGQTIYPNTFYAYNHFAQHIKK